MRITLAGRFWKRAERRGPDECWPWTGTVAADGRGYISDHGTDLIATRLAVALDAGVSIRAIPSDYFVCHTCDNLSCVNPAHLYVGTALDRARDCMRRGRNKRTLTNAQRVEVVRAYRNGEGSTRQHGRRFGVSGVTVLYWVQQAGKVGEC